MADTSWIAEIETGRWYIWGPGPNGENIRRYLDELDTTNSYQPNNDHLYGQYPSPSSAGQVYETALLSNPSSSLTRQYTKVPRGPSSRADQPQYSEQGQYEVVTSLGSRLQKYLDPGGYNPEPEPDRRLASYQTETPSIRAPIKYPEPAAYDPNSLSMGMSRLSVNELNSSPNSLLSRSPPQPQWTATPSGRGRGSYQGPGKEPAARQPSRSRPIRATLGESEDLDPKYRMRNTDWKAFFQCGRVFKTLWTDPAGPEDASEADQFMSKARYKVAHNQYVYSKIRRFVVVSRHDRSCQCLPVTTYDGKGYRKRNIKLEEHGLIYTGKRPKTVPGISMEPLFIKNAAEQLDVSYINYGRSYCVDTNVKVRDVGVLDSTSRKLLRQNYKQVNGLNDGTSFDLAGVDDIGIVPAENSNNAETSNLGENALSTQSESCVQDTAEELIVALPGLPSLSRASSRSSLASIASWGSIFSRAPSTQSSTSSASFDPSYQQRLEDLLLADAELRALFETAVLKTTFQRFEDNFKRCLQLFAAHLRIEAPASLPNQAFRLVRKHSSNIAHSIRRKFENSSSLPESGINTQVIFEYETDDDISDGEGDDNEEIDSQPVGMEELMLATNSFRMLRENFRIFLLSDQVSRAVFDCWPVTLLWSESLEIEYSGISSLFGYLKSRPQD